MAAYHGKRGVVTFTNLTFEMISWTIEATADVVEVTVMNAAAVAAATHWKEYLAGFKDWTATCNVILPVAGIASTLGTELGSEAALAIETTDGKLYTGNAICIGIGMASGTDAAGTATLSFQGTDQLEENA